MARRIYLAGPDVFLSNAKAIGAEKVRLCAEAGFIGMFPLDAPLQLHGKSHHAQARDIQAACETMMRACDVCLANCTPFRGASMDSGTAYEIGFMRALGKPIYGYTSTTLTYADRVRHARQDGSFARAPGLTLSDPPDSEIEDFSHAENLMIAVAAQTTGHAIIASEDRGPDALAALTAFRKALETLHSA